MKNEIRYLSACGMLGYGFPKDGFLRACDSGIDFIGVDAGSTDPGPYYLGSGRNFVNPIQVRRDLEIALLAARAAGVPLIIGSAGGAGARPHVDSFLEILTEISKRNKLSFKLAVIYSDVARDMLKKALAEGRIRPCGPVPELTPERIERVSNPVAQLGTDPIIAALEAGAEVIVSGRCCDTAIFASYPIWKGFDPGLSLHCAKIAECGALCAYPAGANDSLLCALAADHFVVEPVNPARACTPESVAAHSLYEQPDPESFHEPEGTVDMRPSVFTAVSPRAVKVEGSRLIPAARRTLKLEGAELKGYRAVTIAGVTDPGVISHLDELQEGVRKAVADNLGGIAAEGSYTLLFRRYGLDGAAFNAAGGLQSPHEIGLLIDVVAPTQALADSILGLARSTALHQPFPGRKATAGNLAFPFSPSDFSAGAVYEFSLYHLLEDDNSTAGFRPHYMNLNP